MLQPPELRFAAHFTGYCRDKVQLSRSSLLISPSSHSQVRRTKHLASVYKTPDNTFSAQRTLGFPFEIRKAHVFGPFEKPALANAPGRCAAPPQAVSFRLRREKTCRTALEEHCPHHLKSTENEMTLFGDSLTAGRCLSRSRPEAFAVALLPLALAEWHLSMWPGVWP